MADPISLTGRTAIVTGASRGIGRGIARVFSEAGANLVLIARTEAPLEEVAGSLDPSRTIAVPGDVKRAEDIQRAIDTARELFGGLDVFCHNAGIYPQTPIEQIDLSEWHEVIDTNLTSTFLAVKACMPVMREQQSGRIVLISSITGVLTGYPGLSHYSATKAGMLGFMRTAALELAPFRVTINAIEPGTVRTEGLAGLGEDAIDVAPIPLGAVCEPEDIAYSALFLASDGARLITGQTIVVDGGQTLPEVPL